MKETYKDLDCTVTYEVNPAHVDFSVYEIIGHSGSVFDKPIYEGIGGCGADEKSTGDINKANKYIHGTVKWDGCSHVYFGDEGYIHMCGGNEFKRIGAILEKVYKRCYELGKFDFDPI